jgi:hypothetical protein
MKNPRCAKITEGWCGVRTETLSNRTVVAMSIAGAR